MAGRTTTAPRGSFGAKPAAHNPPPPRPPGSAAGGPHAAAVRHEFLDRLRSELAARPLVLFHPAAQPPHRAGHAPDRSRGEPLLAERAADPGLQRPQRPREAVLPHGPRDPAQGFTNIFFHDISPFRAPATGSPQKRMSLTAPPKSSSVTGSELWRPRQHNLPCATRFRARHRHNPGVRISR